VNGLTHLRARDYDASTGQFLSVDPLESPVGSVTGGNPYHYVGNDPLNYVDPSGMGRICDGGTGGFSAGVRQWGCENPLAETAVGMLPGVGCAYSMAKWEGLDIVLDCVPGLWSKMKSGFKAARGLKRARAARQALPGLKSAADDLIEGGLKNTNILNAAADEARIAAETERAIAGNADEVADGAKWVDGKAVEDAAAVQNVSESAGEQATKELGEAAGEKAAKATNSPACPLNSFVAETHVLMADGSTKHIDEVAIGEMVMATDPDTGHTEPHEVLDLITGEGLKHLVDIKIKTKEGVRTIIATDGHPFWVDDLGAFVRADQLRRGDDLLTPMGYTLEVYSLKKHTEWIRVHNLTVEGVHTYYVLAGHQPVLVHNQGGRRGNQATRDQNQKIIEEFLADNPDYTLVGGGRDPATGLNVKEEYLPPLDGSRKGASYPDITLEAPDGSRIRINTVDSLVSGEMTDRERLAFNRIFEQTGETVIAIPKTC
jgi:RHS repeat-associated protein